MGACVGSALRMTVRQEQGDCKGMTLDDNIRALRASMQCNDARLSELAAVYSPPNHCCPSCASSEYRSLCAKYERQEAWLKVLLSKGVQPGKG